jgi:hypothetical protein
MAGDKHLVHGNRLPRQLRPEQGLSLAGLILLVLAVASIPLTVALKADYFFDHPKLSLAAAAAVALPGAVILQWAAPRLINRPGWRAAVPGGIAAAAAIAVWLAQGPVTAYYFADPMDRYQRQYTNGCLAASPYRLDQVQTQLVGATLVVRPLNGETTLRLGPAKEGGTDPLRPLDHATRSVLNQHGC